MDGRVAAKRMILLDTYAEQLVRRLEEIRKHQQYASFREG
jgi:hypothetical protein